MTTGDALADLWVVVMAGGAGTRFWPASTESKPKQLLALTSDRTLLQMTVDRVRSRVPPARTIIVTNTAFAGAIQAQLPEVPAANILCEPQRRDTAAAVSWAALEVQQRAAAATVAVLTSDHVITPPSAFVADLERAVGIAKQTGALVTFGIPPTFPSTGFGYLEPGAGDRLASFVEKPDRARAEQLVHAGCLWNSGMFVFTAAAIARELTLHVPAHVQALTRAVRHEVPLPDAFAALPRLSFDHGVMEKVKDVRFVRARFSWSDVGSFPALAEHLPKDADGNASNARTVAQDARDNVVWASDTGELVALLGVSDLVVVRAGRRTLIAPKARAEEIKQLVDALAPEDRT